MCEAAIVAKRGRTSPCYFRASSSLESRDVRATVALHFSRRSLPHALRSTHGSPRPLSKAQGPSRNCALARQERGRAEPGAMRNLWLQGPARSGKDGRSFAKRSRLGAPTPAKAPPRKTGATSWSFPAAPMLADFISLSSRSSRANFAATDSTPSGGRPWPMAAPMLCARRRRCSSETNFKWLQATSPPNQGRLKGDQRNQATRALGDKTS